MRVELLGSGEFEGSLTVRSIEFTALISNASSNVTNFQLQDAGSMAQTLFY